MIDIAQARNEIERREAAQHDRNLARCCAAQQDFERIKARIIEKYRPVRIWQWGSLLDPHRFDETSDIDLAVEGVTDATTWFALLGDAMMLTRFSLDVVQLERMEPEFAATIREKGRIVYERKC